MKVKYIVENLKEKLKNKLTENEERFFSDISVMPNNLHLTFGKIYIVLGVEYTENGFVNFMISDDTDVTYPSFYPSEFFKIVDNRVSKYWINRPSNFYPFKEIHFPNLITFYEAIKNSFFFDDLLKCKKKALEAYETNKELMENDYPEDQIFFAERLSDTWVMCAYCDDSWETDNVQGIIKCPKNSHRNNNPFWNDPEVNS
ncbi:MAG: hypothetical protein H7X99_01640 [Saprospiraceae bacterium]|nr:hypothetical protein [Saprospiraceae bacterium]